MEVSLFCDGAAFGPPSFSLWSGLVRRTRPKEVCRRMRPDFMTLDHRWKRFGQESGQEARGGGVESGALDRRRLGSTMRFVDSRGPQVALPKPGVVGSSP